MCILSLQLYRFHPEKYNTLILGKLLSLSYYTHKMEIMPHRQKKLAGRVGAGQSTKAHTGGSIIIIKVQKLYVHNTESKCLQ